MDNPEIIEEWLNRWKGKPVTDEIGTTNLQLNDARLRPYNYKQTKCSNHGRQFNPEHTYQCKHYQKASFADRCMHYRESMGGACDCNSK